MAEGRDVVGAIEAEYRRYRDLGLRTLAQLDDSQVHARSSETENSVATLVQHVAGNLRSRFTDFLTSDGEKPWRNRDGEFEPRASTRSELEEDLRSGFDVLLHTLATLHDEHLAHTVTIRQQPLRVMEALARSLAHTAYHVGQIVQLGKSLRGASWTSLSIPPGGSAAYNARPTLEKPPGA